MIGSSIISTERNCLYRSILGYTYYKNEQVSLTALRLYAQYHSKQQSTFKSPGVARAATSLDGFSNV